MPQQNNVEELYAKVQKPRDRKKAAANKEPPVGKDLMMNGSNHTIEDSSPPPLPVAGECLTYCTYSTYLMLKPSNRRCEDLLSSRLQFRDASVDCI